MEFPTKTSLNKEDCEAIVRNLDAAISILDRNMGRRSLAEVRVRSMMAVLRIEVAETAGMEITRPPFAFKLREKQ